MPKQPRVVAVQHAEVAGFLGKARQFLAGAEDHLAQGRHDGALMDAIHAAIVACDAVTGHLGGVRSADPDHARAVDLLERVTRTEDVAGSPPRQLAMLIAKKNVVEYEARRATMKEASEGVERARRFVRWAADLIERSSRQG